MAVLAVLAALLVQAVISARGAARRVACASNLRQLGVALQSYAADINAFPPGMTGNGYAVHSMLLPYIDQSILYDSVNFQVNVRRALRQDGCNITAYRTAVTLYLCPADRGADGRVGWTNYAGNRGSGVQTFGYNGAFSLELQGLIGFAAFRDGTSNTVSMSEWTLGPQTATEPRSRRWTFATARVRSGPNELEDFAADCGGIDPATAKLALLIKGRGWIRGDVSYTLYNHVLGPGQLSCTNGDLVQQGAWTAGSLHPSGVNVLFVDGHTRLISNSIALPVWRAIASRDGGETIADGSL